MTRSAAERTNGPTKLRPTNLSRPAASPPPDAPRRSRARAKPKQPNREQRQPSDLVQWLTDGQRVIDSISRTLAEQRELEIRLTALERAHGTLRDELAGLADDEPDERVPGSGVLGNGWVRAGLVALILVIVTIVSIPYFIDWWQALTPPRHG